MDLITKKKGEFEETYDTEGHFLYSGTYKDGNGLLRTWCPSGALESEGNFKNVHPVGVMKKYYDNGQIEATFQLDDEGQPYGFYKQWYPNGQLALEKEYRAGSIAHTEKHWDEEGHLVEEIHYNERNELSKQRLYYLNGQIGIDTTWDDYDRPNGICISKHYNEEGQLSYSVFCRADHSVEIQKSWNDSGILIREDEFGEEGVLKSSKVYSESTGNLLRQEREYNGHLLVEEWDESGARISRDVFRSDNRFFTYVGQIEGFHLEGEKIITLRYYQPVKVKGGWLQLDLDGQARYFKSDPTNIHDEVHKLAQELAPALWDQLDMLCTDPDKYILIKTEEKIDGDSLATGNLQSLSAKSEKKSNGMKV